MERAKERVLGVLQEGRATPPVVFPVVVANHAARISKVPLFSALTDARVLEEVLYAAYRLYNYDLIMVFADVLVEAEAMGGKLEFFDDEPPVLIEPAGERARVATSGREGRMALVIDATTRLVARAGKEVFVLTSLKGPFSLATFLCGPEEFFTSLLNEPARAEFFLKLAVENQKVFAREIVRAGGVPFIGDPMASGSVISPQVFSRFALPYIKELVDTIHQLGTWTGLHICGDTSQILPMLPASGAEVLSIDEMDLVLVRKQVGARQVIMGNVSTGLLETGSAEEVAQAAQVCLKNGGDRLILATACDVPPDAPVDNVRALVKVAKEWQW